MATAARDAPGWLSLIEALDQFAAGTVARLEHELTRADRARVEQLRHQLLQAYRLEAVTTGEATRARHRIHTAHAAITAHAANTGEACRRPAHRSHHRWPHDTTHLVEHAPTTAYPEECLEGGCDHNQPDHDQPDGGRPDGGRPDGGRPGARDADGDCDGADGCAGLGPGPGCVAEGSVICPGCSSTAGGPAGGFEGCPCPVLSVPAPCSVLTTAAETYTRTAAAAPG